MDVADLWPEHGGTLYRIECALHLVRGRPTDVSRVILALVAVAWVPFVLLGLVEWWRVGAPEPLLNDGLTHARLLVALPLLAVADWCVDARCHSCVDRIFEQRFVTGHEAEQAAHEALKARRLRDSKLIEAALVAVIGVVAVGHLVGWIPAPLDAAEAEAMTPARVFHTLVSRPIFQFMLLRQIWRWIIWAELLFAISRVPMRLLATHPDRCGGLRFLTRPSVNLAVFLSALSVVLSATWSTQLAAGAAHLKDYVPELVVFVGVGLLVALGPLLVFLPQLARTKRDTARSYSGLAMDYVHEFHRRWIRPDRPNDLLGTSDLQSLADLGNSFQVVEQSTMLLFRPRDVTVVILSMLGPILPLMLYEFPADQLLRRIAGAVFSVPF
jgi:hypothetical protein